LTVFGFRQIPLTRDDKENSEGKRDQFHNDHDEEQRQ
jgi:hypothetical protein